MAWGNRQQRDWLHAQDSERDAQQYQEVITVIDKQVEEGAVEGDGFTVEPRIRHRHVFDEIKQGAGAVKKYPESTGMTCKIPHRQWTRCN